MWRDTVTLTGHMNIYKLYIYPALSCRLLYLEIMQLAMFVLCGSISAFGIIDLIVAHGQAIHSCWNAFILPARWLVVLLTSVPSRFGRIVDWCSGFSVTPSHSLYLVWQSPRHRLYSHTKSQSLVWQSSHVTGFTATPSQNLKSDSHGISQALQSQPQVWQPIQSQALHSLKSDSHQISQALQS